jgi:hypothetical protein
MTYRFVRTIRTLSSERFVLQDSAGNDAAALELHYLGDRRVSGTLILLGPNGVPDDQIPDLLKEIDELLLPDVSVQEGNLTFTVVRGSLAGSYVANSER